MTQLLGTPTNLFDYFQRCVEDARDELSVPLTDDTRLYLAKLLTDRARTDIPSPPEDTLAELHARAAHSRPSVQARTYRELGDRALYRLGCFRESLDGKTVGPRYYRTMGSAAYHRVDEVLRVWFASAFGPVFKELASQFDQCVALLDEVRRRHPESELDALMSIYERWLATGSDDLAARLRAKGLLLAPKHGAH